MPSPVVLVTGAAGALGSTVARQLVASGYKAALVDVPQSAPRLGELAKELGGAAAPADITAPSVWAELLARVEKELGAPVSHAALVAGGWQGGKPLHEETDDAVWRAMMTQNLATVYASLRALLPGMVARKHGSIVVIGARPVERPWTSA